MESIAPESVADQRRCLIEVGAKMSDLFGADRVFWVEGSTEEECYRLILERLGESPPLGLSIEGVRATGDFQKKRPSPKLIWDIYSKLSKGTALIPPAVAFLFDREERTQAERDKLSGDSSGKVRFLSRKMYENYLICPEALAAIMNRLPSFRGSQVTQEEISDWLTSNGGKSEFYTPADERVDLDDSTWLENVHGAKLLAKLVVELSSDREEYRKTTHSIQLTEWLIENKPQHLQELKDLLMECVRD